MSDVREATHDLLADSPALADPLHALLDVDADGPFEFDDVPLDSGQFGEVVAAGLVEDTGDGYRVVDRDAVRRALDERGTDESASEASSSSAAGGSGSESGLTSAVGSVADRIAAPSTDRRSAAALAVALAFVALVRVVPMWGPVFRHGDVVLAGNDPYFYRYWGEELLAGSLSAFDVAALGELPGQVPTHDTVTIVSVWWTSALLGGDAEAVGTVLAWYPVVAGVLTALGCYLLAVWLTDDRRVGLAAVLLLAVTPTHAYRTALGFGDHHAADYVWLVVVTLAVVVLARERLTVSWDRDNAGESRADALVAGLSPRGLGGVLLLGVGVAGQTHAWRAGPLMLIPVGLYLVAQVALDVERDRAPLAAHGPLLAGLLLGAVLSAVAHVGFGWAPVFRAFAPVLLFAGALAVVLAGKGASRTGLSTRQTAVGEVAVGVGGGALALATVPALSNAVDQGIAYFVRTGQSGIAETYSLFSGTLGSIVGPIVLFGFAFFLALPYLAWGAWYARRADRPDWLAAAAFGWYFLALAVVQSRFAGQLSLFTAAFGGLGFVHLASVVDVARRPAVLGGDDDSERRFGGAGESRPSALSLPDRRTLGTLALLFLLVASLGVIQTGVKQSQIATDQGTYRTASWIADHADEQNQTYPENYVFSPWGRNRVYNYFVSGESKSYWYAQNNYADFVTSSNPAQWAEQLLNRPVGYVVVPNDISTGSELTGGRLASRFGSRADGVPGVGRYRAVYANDRYSVFDPVRGARVTGTGPANATVEVQTDVSVAGTQFEYVRQEETNRYGDYGVVVPYGSTYNIANTSTSVPDSAVERGEMAGGYVAHYPFDAGEGDNATDPVGGTTAAIRGAEWTDGVHGNALQFDASENDSVVVRENGVQLNGSEEFTVCVRAKPGESDARTQDVVHVGKFDVLLSWHGSADRWHAYFHNGTEPHRLRTKAGPGSKSWQQVCLRYDGSTFQMWMDGELVSERPAEGTVAPAGGRTAFGSNGGKNRYFDGAIGDVRVYDTAIPPEQIGTLANES